MPGKGEKKKNVKIMTCQQKSEREGVSLKAQVNYQNASKVSGGEPRDARRQVYRRVEERARKGRIGVWRSFQIMHAGFQGKRGKGQLARGL